MLQSLLDGPSYMAHGYCLLWKPWLVSLHAFSDFFIFLAYSAIPIAIWLFIRNRRGFAMNNLAWLFCAFILLCGASHLAGLITLWWPVYEVQGVVKFLTAGVSVIAALVIFPLIPKAIALPSPEELTAANRRLQEEVQSHRETAAALARARDDLQQKVSLQELELQRNAALLATISEATEALIYAKDAEGRLVFANPALLHFVGRPATAVIGKTEFEFLADEAQARIIAANDRRIMQSRGSMVFEEAVMGRDGRTVTYLSTKIAQRAPDDTVIGLVGISIDVSESKRLREENEAAAERYRARTEELETLLDVIPAAVFIASDPEANSMVGNRYCHELLRVPIGSSVARSAPTGIRPEHFEVLRNGTPVSRDDLPVRHAAITGRPVRDIELEIAFRDGDRRTIFGSAAPLFDTKGMVRGSVGTYVDITERKRAEQQLRESEERFSKAFNAAAHPMSITTLKEGRYVDINAAGLAAAGLTRDQVIGRTVRELGFYSDSTNYQKVRDLLSGEGQFTSFETTLESKRGPRIYLLSGAVVDLRGEPCLLTSAVDITERKQAEERVQLLMRELNHRTNNLLTVVDALTRQTARTADPTEFAERLSARLAGLAASNKLLLSDNWLGVGITDLLASQLAPFAEIGERIVTEGPEVRLTPNAAQAIGMALHELATNAVKYGALSPQGGHVSIRWSCEETAGMPTFAITWSEHDGPTVAVPNRVGFGRTVVDRMIARALKGRATLEFAPCGVVWTFSCPLQEALESKGQSEGSVSTRHS
jgi:PAS domain S-box-containing protein